MYVFDIGGEGLDACYMLGFKHIEACLGFVDYEWTRNERTN